MGLLPLALLGGGALALIAASSGKRRRRNPLKKRRRSKKDERAIANLWMTARRAEQARDRAEAARLAARRKLYSNPRRKRR